MKVNLEPKLVSTYVPSEEVFARRLREGLVEMTIDFAWFAQAMAHWAARPPEEVISQAWWLDHRLDALQKRIDSLRLTLKPLVKVSDDPTDAWLLGVTDEVGGKPTNW